MMAPMVAPMMATKLKAGSYFEPEKLLTWVDVNEVENKNTVYCTHTALALSVFGLLASPYENKCILFDTFSPIALRRPKTLTHGDDDI